MRNHSRYRQWRNGTRLAGPCIGNSAYATNFIHFRSLYSKWAMPAFFVSGGRKMDPTIARIWELAAPLAKMEGMEIIDIELRHEGSRGGRVLRLYLDKEGGPNMDDLSRVSRELSDALDVREIVEGAYTLEVSSPGINRPLRRPEHFARFVGKKVRVRTREMINGRRSFVGQLLEVSADKISLNQDGRPCEIPFSVIEKSNYEHDWSA
jgi:ribosome maturation factor RimP